MKEINVAVTGGAGQIAYPYCLDWLVEKLSDLTRELT